MICPRCESTAVDRVTGQRTAKCDGCGFVAHVTRFRDPLTPANSLPAPDIDGPFGALRKLFPQTDYMDVEQPTQTYAKRRFRGGLKHAASNT